MTNKTERVIFRVSKNMKDAVDKYCEERKISQSKLMYEYYRSIAFAQLQRGDQECHLQDTAV